MNQDLKNKENSKIGKVIVDSDLCIGAGPCATFAPNTFHINEEGKAVVVDPTGDSDDEIITAAMSCPVLAIKIYDKEGNLIYPK